MMHRTLLLLLLCFSPALAVAAETMFEGYYRVEVGGKHVGYTIQRFEYEPKDKTFTAISFLRIKNGEDVIQESLKAKANQKLEPLSYSYSSQAGKELKAIDGTFKGKAMSLNITDGKNLTKKNGKLEDKTIFSNFLLFLLMQKPLVANGESIGYTGIAEEDDSHSFYDGKALVTAVVPKSGERAYDTIVVKNTFRGETFEATLAGIRDPKRKGGYEKLDLLSTSAPTKGISTKLVRQPSEATENQSVPNKILVSLFGNMPTGKANLLTQSSNDEP